MSQDLFLIIGWWTVLFLIGASALPFTRKLFSTWWDQGYLLSKAVGLAGVTFITWYLGSFKILPFSQGSIIFSIGIVFIIGVISQNLKKTEQVLTRLFNIIGIQSPFGGKESHEDPHKQMISWKKMIVLELLFFSCLWFWSYIKAFEPDIRGLEKFMDYGFARTIFNSSYFPPPDMWYSGGTINYYYFGHTMMALLSKLSSIDLAYGYNLMLATIFAFCFTMSFGIGVQLFMSGHKRNKDAPTRYRFWAIITGLLAAWLVTMAGNMQTIYAFTKGYNGEDTPPPFWLNTWPADQFLAKLPETMNSYWYANATRFIPFTIHEFPSYSFVVSDNHGHVLSIPLALLAISALLTMFGVRIQEEKDSKKQKVEKPWREYLSFGLYGILGGILLMTNALDGPIYMGLLVILLGFSSSQFPLFSLKWLQEKGEKLVSAVVGLLLAAAPFLFSFTSFSDGLAVNCPPKFLENMTFGPIIFETVDKCQKSPFWMVWLLWGFFFFCGITLILSRLRRHSGKNTVTFAVSPILKVLIILFLYCVGLIFFSEFFYFKDIYPAHFRSNTMFKLGYQSFMICSLMSAFVIVQVFLKQIRNQSVIIRFCKRLFLLLIIPQLFLVSIYPFFSVRSYFGNLQTYKGLYGLEWFERDYPDDFQAMLWLSEKAKEKLPVSKSPGMTFLARLSRLDDHVHDTFFTSHVVSMPVLVEADGDSYTDYGRMSAFAGMQTIVGWGVHEWLWRGTYDVVSPRKDEVLQIYESTDSEKRMEILNKYNIRYIVVGKIEREKFKNLNESAITAIGTEVFRAGDTVIYEKN